MSELWDESMFDLERFRYDDARNLWYCRDGRDEDIGIDTSVMGLVYLMMRAAREMPCRFNRLAATVDYPSITEEEVREWRN